MIFIRFAKRAVKDCNRAMEKVYIYSHPIIELWAGGLGV
jgi:hypothetical protein